MKTFDPRRTLSDISIRFAQLIYELLLIKIFFPIVKDGSLPDLFFQQWSLILLVQQKLSPMRM